MSMLTAALPGFADTNPSAMFELAASTYDDADMIENALNAFGATRLKGMAEDMKGRNETEQWGLYQTMNPTVRDALGQMGWQPQEPKDEGFWRSPIRKPEGFGLVAPFQLPFNLGGAAQSPIAAAKAVGGVAKTGASFALKALAYPIEEVARGSRVAPLMDAQHEALQRSGMSAEEFQATTGIDVSNRSAVGGMLGDMAPGSFGGSGIRDPRELLNLVAHPEDIWGALRTWKSIGHDGSDDYLATVQSEVYQQLEDNWEGQGKDLLRYAKAIANGQGLDEIAESEQLPITELQGFVDQLALIQSDEVFRKALSRLESGRVSPGRTLMRQVARDEDKNVSDSWWSLGSGSTDLAFQIVADPTVVAGKLTKAVRVARWAVRSEDAVQLSRWQHLVGVVEKANAGASADEVATLLADVPGRGWSAARFGSEQARLISEAKAIHAPAAAAADAFKTGDFEKLRRQFPGFETSIKDMQRYHAALVEAGEEGLTSPTQIFEFYKHILNERSVLGTVDGLTPNPSHVLFGHNGMGHKMVPHATAVQRARLNARAGFSDWVFERGLTREAAEALTEHADEATRAADEALDAGQPAPAEYNALVEEAFGDDDALATAAQGQLAVLDKAAELDEKVIDPDTFGFVLKRGSEIPKAQLAKFLRTMTTKVPQRGFVPIAETADPTEFRRFAESLGVITNTSKAVVEARVNRFIVGGEAERHMLINKMIYDAADLTGILDSPAGKEIIRKHITKSNQVYGYNQLVRHSIDDTRSKNLIVHQAVYEGQTAEGVAIPSFRDWIIATGAVAGKANVMRYTAGKVRNSQVEAFMSRAWKPLTMLRLGFPLRAGGDEALQAVGRVGAGFYLREKFLRPWAGIRDEAGELALNPLTGEPLAEPQAAFAPVRWVTSSIAHMAGVSDEVLEVKALDVARTNANWAIANPAQRAQMVAEATKTVRKDLRALPRILHGMDLAAQNTALFTSKAFHQIAGERSIISRSELANRLLKADPEYAGRVEAYQLMLTHHVFEDAYARSFGHAISQGADFDGALYEKAVDIADFTSDSGVRSIRMSRRGDYAWVGHNDLGLFTHHYDKALRAMSESPSTKAALREVQHFVPQTVVDEVAAEFGWALNGEEGIDAIRAIREAIANGPADEVAHRTASLEALSERSRLILTGKKLNDNMLTTDLNVVADRAVNASYNALRTIDGSKKLRSLVSASTMDGKLPAVPLRAGHDRLYFPVVDRRSAEAIVNMMGSDADAARFAEALTRHLSRINARGEGQAVFEAFAPPEGSDLATVMAGLKATLMTRGGNLVPAGSAATSNYRIAEAVRDAIAEVLPSQTLDARLGFIDHPSSLYDPKFGVTRMSDSPSVVNVASYQLADMTVIDPDSLQRLVHVEIPNPGGLAERRWLGEHELEEVAGTVGRTQSFKKKHVSRSRTFTRVEGGEIRVNQGLIDADFDNGKAFLKGAGGEMRRRTPEYGWADPAMAARADALDDKLERLGLLDTTGLDLHDLIGRRRIAAASRQPVPFEVELRNNQLWDEFVEVAKAAKRSGSRVSETWVDETAQRASPIVAAAMQRLQLTPAMVGSKKQYQDLIVERAKVHEVLRASGERPALVASEEAIEREMDALAHAWQAAGLPSNPELAKRLTMVPRGGNYKVLGEVWTSGFTEEAGVRRAAQTIADEVRRTVYGAKSGEPMHELIIPLLQGEHTSDRIIRAVPIDELPTKAFGPRELLEGETTFAKSMGRFYQDIADPAIAAISRDPMTADMFYKQMKNNRHIRDMLVNQEVDGDARRLLADIGVDPDDMKPVNEILMAKIGSDKDFGAGEVDEMVSYARAIFKDDHQKAAEGLAALVLKGRLSDDLVVAEAQLATKADELLGSVDWDLLRGWHLNISNATETWVRRSSTQAIDNVIPFVDNYRDRSAFQEYLGPVFIPFFYAEEQFLRRLARGVYETPHMIRKAQLTMHGMESIGVVREDARGNKNLVIPGSDLLVEAVGSVAAMVTGNDAYRVDVDPFGMRTDFVLPGWNATESRFGLGPVIGLAADQIATRFPEADWAGRMDREHWWEHIVPASITGGYKLFAGDTKEIGTAEVSAIGALYAAGMGPEEGSASDDERFLEDVRSVTRAIGGVRYATGLLSFGKLSPLDKQAGSRQEYIDLLSQGVSRDVAQQVLAQQHTPTWSKEFNDLLGQGVSHEEAVWTLMERHGANGLVWTIFGTDNQVGAPLPANEGTWEFMLDHEDLIRDNPETMAWLFPQQADGDEFDRRAYNEATVLGLREKRTPQEFLDAIRIAQAAPQYFKMVEDRRAERDHLTKSKAPDQMKQQADLIAKAERDSYLNQHPALVESFSNDASERRKKVLRELPLMIQGGVGGHQGEVLLPLLQLYTVFQTDYASYSGQSSKQARAVKTALAQNFYTEATLYVRAHPEATAFFNSVIKYELPDNADDVKAPA